jgi:hypothetical protein
MPLRKLRAFVHDLQTLIAELENSPRREIDIATEHTGDPALVAGVLRTDGDPKSGKWYQVERIYCSIERCPSCPHGDFQYRYQCRKDGKVSKRYVCTMAIGHETIEWMRECVRQGVAYELKSSDS